MPKIVPTYHTGRHPLPTRLGQPARGPRLSPTGLEAVYEPGSPIWQAITKIAEAFRTPDELADWHRRCEAAFLGADAAADAYADAVDAYREALDYATAVTRGDCLNVEA